MSAEPQPSPTPTPSAPPPPPVIAEASPDTAFEKAASPLQGDSEPPRVTLGIRHKLIGLMVAAVFLIVGAVASYFPARQIGELRSGLRDRASVYARLGSQQLRSAVAFSDRETAREVLAALAKDSLIDGMALYDDKGALLHGEGQLSELAKRTSAGFAEPKVFYLPGRVLATAPVKSLEGPRGTLVLELSTRSATEARDRLIRAALLVGLLALAAGTGAAWLIARSLAERVERVAHAATAVAKGDLDNALSEAGPADEIGVLTHGFNAMVKQLRHLIAHIQQSAKEESERLERLVQERTAQLDAKNRDLQLVLDNVEQGFITIDRDGVVTGEHSRIIDSWLGALDKGDELWPYLDKSSPGLGENLEVGWTEVVDGLMPLALTLAQMPSSLRVGERHLRLEFKPIGDEGFETCLVVISDVTATVARERSEQEGRDLLALTSRLVDDRSGFVEFLGETRNLLLRIESNRADLKLLKRDLHTLKGNTAIYGMAALSSTCHELEGLIDTGSVDAATLDRGRLTEQWTQTDAKLQQLLGDRQRRHIEIDESQHRALLSAIRKGASGASLARMVESFALESLEVRLARFGEQLAATARRLEKGEVEVVVSAPSTYVSREQLADFWAVFSHVIRNAAAHGLEQPEVRVRAGKSSQARFDLRAGVQGDRFFIELEDNGPGVDWERVRLLAEERGLPSRTQADLTNALFVDGISTELSINEVAGRGVGLSAVRATCERTNGTIEVVSNAGNGALFRFWWPAKELKSLTLVDWSEAS